MANRADDGPFQPQPIGTGVLLLLICSVDTSARKYGEGGGRRNFLAVLPISASQREPLFKGSWSRSNTPATLPSSGPVRNWWAQAVEPPGIQISMRASR